MTAAFVATTFVFLSAFSWAAVTHDAPSINGLVEGDLFQLTGQSVNLNSSARIEGTWFLPGTPNLILQGGVLESGAITHGNGPVDPSGYTIRLNSNSYVEAMTDRTLLVDLPSAGVAQPSSGNRSVHINNPSNSIGDPATLKNLTINASNVEVALPGGAYNQLSVNGHSRLRLGTPGASEREVYDISRLQLNSNGKLDIVGPVLIRLKNQFNPNSIVGNQNHPEWLRIEMASGGMNINSNARVYAVIICPSKSVHINGLLEGSMYADKIVINSNGTYRERASIFPTEPGGNEVPLANSDSFDLPEDGELSTALSGSDPDGDSLVFSILTAPVNGAATLSENGQLTYSPASDFFGSDSLEFQVFDGESTSEPALVQLNVSPVNDAPSASTAPFSVLEDTIAPISINIDDVDSSTFTLRIDSISGGMLSGPIDNLLFTPDPNYFGPASFTAAVLDGDGGEAVLTESFVIGEVNDPPVPTNTFFATDEDVALSVVLEATDVEAEALVFGLVDSPDHGAASILFDGTFNYTPDADFNGVDSFEVSVEDASGALVVYDLTITVNPVNDAPRAVNQTFGLLEDSTLGQIVVALDIEEDPITFFVSTAPVNGTAQVSTDGSFEYTPQKDYNGPDQIGITVSDDSGAPTDFFILLTVDPVNDIPFAEASNWNVDEDTTLTGQLTGTDIDGDLLTYAAVTFPNNGVLSVSSDGSFIYTGDANFNGGDSFTFTVNDGVETSEPATVVISVDPVNDAPEASDQNFETSEEIQFQASIVASDVDGDILNFVLQASPQRGTVSVDPNGAFTYDPEPEYSGSDGFIVTVTDGIDTIPINITVVVLAANDAPVASDLNFVLPEDSFYQDSLVATDVDSDALTYSVVSLPTSGILKTSTGTVILAGDLPFDLGGPDFTYTPDLDFNGNDSFFYLASDGELNSPVATVNLQVIAGNDAPVASAASITTQEDLVASGNLSGLDVEGSPLTFSLASPSLNGAVVVNVDGSFTYTPDADFNGSDSFSFVVSDGTLASLPAEVSVEITAVNDAPLASAASEILDEDTILTSSFSAFDVDSDALSFELSVPPLNGSVTVDPDGTFSYMPNANFNGSDSFTFSVSDGSLSDTAQISITIASVNDLPTAKTQSVEVDEDDSLSIILSGNDVDGDSLSYVITAQPTNGVISGELPNPVYTPNENFSGEDSFTFAVNDGLENSLEATVQITVIAVNDIPVALAQSVEVEEDVVFLLTLSGSDVEGEPLFYTIVDQPANGVLTGVAPDLTYTPDANFSGSDSFSFTVSDAEATSPPASVEIDVAAVNDLPVANPDISTTDEDSPVIVPVLSNDGDIDGDNVSVAAISGEYNGSAVLNPDGTVTFTPDVDFNGEAGFSYQISDTFGLSEVVGVVITVNAVNDRPIATADSAVLNEDGILNSSLSASDVDGDALTYNLVSAASQGAVVVNADGSYQYIPNSDFNGSDSFDFTVSDGVEVSDAATVDLTVIAVNDAPIAVLQSLLLEEDAALPIVLTGSDVDDNPLVFAVTVEPSNGTLSGIAPDLTYTPNANFFGIDAFSFTVADAEVISAPAEVSLNVTAVNDPPTTSEQSFNVQEDAQLVETLAAFDVEGAPLSFTLVQSATDGILNFNADGTFTYTPNADFSGFDSFSFNLSDGVAFTGPVSVQLAIAAVNDAPVANDDSASVDEDNTVILDVVANDTDVETDALSVSSLDSFSNGTAALNPDGTVTFTPDPNYFGVAGFSYTVTDGESTSELASVVVTVVAVNDTPRANAVAETVAEDQVVTSTLTGSDADGDSLTFSLETASLNGTVDLSVDGNYTYTPNPDFNGPDTFVFTVSDGVLTSEAATAVITVQPVNDVPVAAAQSLVFDEDNAGPVLLTGSDVDGDDLSFAISVQPTNGVLSGTAPNLTYAPNQNYFGADTFSFTVADADVVSGTAEITITVLPVNDIPTASIQSFTVQEDAELTGTLLASDPEGDTLSFSLIGDVTDGSLTFNSNGDFIYSPDADFNGVDSFAYNISDGQGIAGPVSAQIIVEPVDDTPVANPDSAVTNENTPVVINVLSNDRDPDGGVLSISSVTALSNGNVVINPDETITFTPATGYSGDAGFDYTIVDTDGVFTTASVSVEVSPINNAPVPENLSFNLNEDTELSGALVAVDPDGDDIIFGLVESPLNGNLTVTENGSFTYTPNSDFNGADSFTYSVSDGLKNSSALVDIIVEAVNDAPAAQGESLNTGEQESLTILLSATDVDGDTLSYRLTSLPSGGVLVDSEGNPVSVGQLLASPALTYTPNEGFFFSDGFTFVAEDASSSSDEAAIVMTVAPEPRSRTWTVTDDFNEGLLVGISTEVSDQLQLGIDATSLNYLWVPVTTKGTIVRIDIESARVLGEYRSAPSFDPEETERENPSRVTFDQSGNAWIANRTSGLVIRLSPPNSPLVVDRNNDGELTTSSGLNEVLPWTIPESVGLLTPQERASYAGDELITLAIETGITAQFIGIGPDGHVWVGNNAGTVWRQYNGNTGAFLREEIAPVRGLGGYGGFIDSEGVLYSTGNIPLKWDTSKSIVDYDKVWAESHRSGAWDIVQDYEGQFWESKDWNYFVNRYDENGLLIESINHELRWAMGLTVDFDNHLWMAHSHCSRWVSRWLPDGTYIGKVEVANHGPTDVSVDRRGYIWVTGTPGIVQRINPLAGPIGEDGVTPVGEVDIQTPLLGGSIWAFGEFSGISGGTGIADQGTWTAVFDGEIPNAVWGPVVWNADLCNDSLHQVEVSFGSNGLGGWSDWEPINSVGDSPSGTGRFIRVRSTFIAADSGESPILKDLTVGTLGYDSPASDTNWFVDAGPDIDAHWPDPIQMKGALCSTQSFDGMLSPSYEWTVVSAPDSVVFNDSTALRPFVEFGGPGDYVLKLTATDVEGVREDTIVVSLVPYNKAPYVNARDDELVLQSSDTLQLGGIVRDDGLVEGEPLTVVWEKKFGPGDASFSSLTDPEATATFSTPGIYLLQLSANDGEFDVADSLEVRVETPCSVNITDGLVSWWQANCDGIDHISANLGFLEGEMGFAEGAVAAAFDFDGINDRIRVFESQSLDFGNKPGLTFEFWVNLRELRDSRIFEYSDQTTVGVNTSVYSGNGIRFDVVDRDLNSHVIEVDNVLTANNWHHVAVTWERESGDTFIYVDGIPRQAGNTGPIEAFTTGDLFFGADEAETAYFKGQIDEMTAYCRPLIISEVYQIFSAGIFGKCPPNTNLAPEVSIDGPYYSASAPVDVALSATVFEDGAPFGLIDYDWEITSGPSGANLNDSSIDGPTLSLTNPGIYTVRLSVSDGERTGVDTAVVRSGSFCEYEVPESVVAWFRGDESMIDATGENFILSGDMSNTAGRVGQAYAFGSFQETLLIPARSELDLGSSASGWTIEFWGGSAVDGRTFIEWEGDGSRGLRIHDE
ncbi:MAG: Ig-like domain-containing protein, partial [Verrucomicrobiota bacterium]